MIRYSSFLPPALLNLRKSLHATALIAAFSLFTLWLAPEVQAADSSSSAASGVIIGTVTNKATGNGLIGAKVEIKSLNLSAFVDNTGRYLLNVPAGTHELLVTY
ncbi:MAG: hypothetical protein WCQ44_03285, partial [Opitutaceae bacterium]